MGIGVKLSFLENLKQGLKDQIFIRLSLFQIIEKMMKSKYPK